MTVGLATWESIMKRLVATGILLLTVTTPLTAATVTGFVGIDDLWHRCISPKEAEASECTAYVAGIVDFLEVDRAVKGLPACVPPGVTLIQVRQAVTRAILHYVATKPNVPRAAASLAAIAITDKWCP